MSRKVEFLYLQQEDCVKAGGLDIKGALAAVERSFFLHGKGDYILPEKPVLRWGGPETEETIGRVMSMPAFLGGSEYERELIENGMIGPVNTAGLKFIPSRPENPSKYGLPRANAICIILDPDTFMPACIMDGTLVSAMRTGAASGVAAKYLAKPDSAVMGLVGASVQGETQLRAIINSVPSIQVCKVYDINPAACKSFVEKMENQVGIKLIIVDSAEKAVRDSDVISTATIAREPYVKGEWYKKGALHCEISFWDTEVQALGYVDFVVVDDWDQVKHHGADTSWRAVRDGVIPQSKIYGNLGEIIVGDKPGRENRDQIIYFNPIGLGIHDLSEAHRVFKNAEKASIGRMLPLWENPVLG